MTSRKGPVCGTHKKKKVWRDATFEYTEDGVTIQIPGVQAWVCPVDGETSFTPETVDDLITTVRELLEPALRARRRRSMPAQFIVSVS